MNNPLCHHCQSSINQSNPPSLEVKGQKKVFCCIGCLSVTQVIIDSGLSKFYELKQNIVPDTPTIQPKSKSESKIIWSIYDRKDMQSGFVYVCKNKNGQIHTQTHLLINGIHCGACVWLIEKRLKQLPGYISSHVNLSTREATIEYNPSDLLLSEIMSEVSNLGFQPSPWKLSKTEEQLKQENRKYLLYLAVSGIGAMQVMMYAVALYAGAISSDMNDSLQHLLRYVSAIIATGVVAFSAQPFFISAWQNIKHRQPGMNLPVAIAIGAAYIASMFATFTNSGAVYFDSVTMFIFFLLTGRYLEMRARHKTTRETLNTEQILPISCRLKQNNNFIQVPIFTLKKNSILRILEGETIPADGVVISGSSHINESMLTGEHVPVEKTIGDKVIGGTINTNNSLDIRVTHIGAETRLSAITKVMRQAQLDKPKIVHITDKVAAHFVMGLLILSACVFVAWSFYSPSDAFWVTLSVLVVTCPCALSLATPAAMTAAVNSLQKQGILITKTHTLENLNAINHIVFDKTGTLTYATLSLAKIIILAKGDYDKNTLLNIAATLESHSNHPIASAFNSTSDAEVTNITNHIGQGVSGTIAGNIWRIGKPSFVTTKKITYPEYSGQHILLSCNEDPVCWFIINDTLRPDAEYTIQALKRQGYKVTLLSGDTEKNVLQTAKLINLQQWKANCTPEEKLHFISNLQENDQKILMIGDGINDIPVLAKADASAAFGKTSDLTKTTADSVFLGGQLKKVLLLLAMAKRTRCILRQNFVWAIAYNLTAVPLAITGLLQPWMAVIGMTSSSLIVVLNSLRLQNTNQEGQ